MHWLGMEGITGECLELIPLSAEHSECLESRRKCPSVSPVHSGTLMVWCSSYNWIFL